MIFKTSPLGIIRSTIFGLLIAGVSNAVTITVTNNTPNGTASGGSGSGSGLFTTSAGSVSSDRGMPVTTYSVTNVDLTSVGGSATESFTFTITYTANGGTPAFNGFGNVAVIGASGDNNQIDGLEDLTAVIGLNSSSFAGLSLTGYTSMRTGGLGGSESGTVTHGGGSVNATSTNTAFNVSGTSVTLDPAVGTGFNFQGFTAEFVAVPEPSAALIGTLGLVFLLRRRR